MRVSIDWELLDRMRYYRKVKKLCRKMAENMTREDMEDCVETTEKVLCLLPEHLKEGLIDKLIRTIDETGEKHGF